MNSKLLCRSLVLGLLWMSVSCQGTWRGRGATAQGVRTARAEDALRLAELVAIDGWQSREVSFDLASVGSPAKLVYQVPGESDSVVWFLYPSATRSTMLVALKHQTRTPLQLMHLWRDGSVPVPNSVVRREIDPAPSLNANCNWNPALENLKAGNTVMAVWPSAGGSVSFDPISTNFRARLVLVVPPKP